MKLHYKIFVTPRAMLHSSVVRGVVDFVNQCEFSMLLNGELNRAEYGWLDFIARRIGYMIEDCPNIGGNMEKCLIAYEKLLPKINKLLQK